MVVGGVLVAQGGDDFAAQPLVQVLAFRVAEADQGLVEAGFVDHVERFFAVGGVADVDAAGFVGAEAVVEALGVAEAEEAGEVLGGEPGLVVDHHAAQGAAVANEGGWGVCVVHCRTPIPLRSRRHPLSVEWRRTVRG